MLVALDTNILAYAEGIGDSTRCGEAIRLIERLPAELVLLPAQSLGELFRVLTVPDYFVVFPEYQIIRQSRFPLERFVGRSRYAAEKN